MSPRRIVLFTAPPAPFFDLAEDPAEFRNLADDPAYRGLVPEYGQQNAELAHDARRRRLDQHGADRRRALRTRRAAPIGRRLRRNRAYAVHSETSTGAQDGESPARGPGLYRSKTERYGAGDEIRTHDPNLGKVVLYP